MILRLPAAAALLLFLCPIARGESGLVHEKTIRVALRYDDCSARSPAALEDHILAACQRHGIPITFGVVPAVGKGDLKNPADTGHLALPPERIARLKDAVQKGILEIALHGFAHRVARSGMRTEFAGVAYRRQDSLLTAGLVDLLSVDSFTTTFIPPWNSYDTATLNAVAGHGLNTFSAIAGAAVGPENLAIAYAPATCLVPEIRAAVLEARRRGTGIVVPYFHAFEFKEEDPARGAFTFAEFEASLAWLAAQPDVQPMTLGSLHGLPATGREAYIAYSRWHRMTPSFLEKILRPAYRVYPVAGFPVPGGRLLLALAVLGGYLLLAALAALAARLLVSRFRGSGRLLIQVLQTAGMLAAIPTSWIALTRGLPVPFAIAMAILGCSLGIWTGTRVIRPNGRISGSQSQEIPI